MIFLKASSMSAKSIGHNLMELWWNIFWDLFKYCNLWKWISNTKNVIKHHLQACLKLNTLNAWFKSHYVRYSWKKTGCPRRCVNCDATYGIKEFLVWIDYNKTSISFIVNLIWFFFLKILWNNLIKKNQHDLKGIFESCLSHNKRPK